MAIYYSSNDTNVWYSNHKFSNWSELTTCYFENFYQSPAYGKTVEIVYFTGEPTFYIPAPPESSSDILLYSFLSGAINTSFGDTTTWRMSPSTICLPRMFRDCAKLTSINLTNFLEYCQIQRMGQVFAGCFELQTITGLETWDTSKCSRFDTTFADCQKLVNFNISQWKLPDSIIFRNMFARCNQLETIDLSFINVAVTNVEYLFHGCENLKTVIFRNADFDYLENCSACFQDCEKLQTVIVSFDTDWSRTVPDDYTHSGSTFNRCFSIQNWDETTGVTRANNIKSNGYFTSDNIEYNARIYTGYLWGKYLVYEKVSGSWKKVRPLIKNNNLWIKTTQRES